MPLWKWIDIPPVWLLGHLLLARWIAGASDLSLAGPVTQFFGGLGVGAGVVLMALAIVEMRKWKTTLVPHREPSHLVQSGIYRRSRNPIYLGDALVLTGLILYWDAPLALPLVPVFVWIVERRFILPEEDRLRRAYRAEFFGYTQKTRRWI